MKYLKLITFLGLIFLLNACVVFNRAPQATPSSTSWTQRQAQLNNVRDWHIQSAVSIREAQQANIVYVDWQQQGRHYTQQISGPLNISGAKIIGQPGKVTLIQGNQPPIYARNPESLLVNTLHIHLPVSNLYYWVRGLPAPGAKKTLQFDASHRLIFLQQQGWTIQYPSYTTVNGVDLPSTLLLNYPNLQMKMVVKSWQIQ